MDQITKHLMTEFASQNSLTKLPEDKQFEHFAAYIATNDHLSDSLDTTDVVVGSGGDCAIDAITFIVNGVIVTDPAEISDLAATNKYVDASIIIVQAERSSGFDTAKIGNISFGITDFLSESPQLPQNDEIRESKIIADALFKQAGLFTRGNPICFVYYVTTGKWQNDANLTARRDAAKADIESLGLFREVRFECLGADQIQALYRKTKNAVSRQIVFERKLTIPAIAGVDQAYMGVLAAGEYLKLITQDNGEIASSLFHDNVRHWMEWNAVNSDIRQTLLDAAQQHLFPILNNGITIVAQRINPVGDRFVIEDYQIVNGCQTSHVLFACKERLASNMFIPVKILATTDEGIRNSVIRATNRQTEISDDQFFALEEFPKKLETYFPTFDAQYRLYYERRPRQYASENVEKVRIINMPTLVRAYASVYREFPHKTTKNYKGLLKEVGNEIFGKDHFLSAYYAAAFAHYRLDYLFRNNYLPAKLRPARYHILLAARLMLFPDPPAKPNSHEMDRNANKLVESLRDEEGSKKLFAEAATVVESLAQGNLNRDHIRTEPFTESLLRHYGRKFRT
ncbi:AIPR family protein [Prosthecobacter fluviatilis]|uniref:AIPR family protein n=1 Tax=Prosthecobacter fluviatilis TaxID=445931 RepID=A0ABW0KUC7_9BACT